LSGTRARGSAFSCRASHPDNLSFLCRLRLQLDHHLDRRHYVAQPAGLPRGLSANGRHAQLLARRTRLLDLVISLGGPPRYPSHAHHLLLGLPSPCARGPLQRCADARTKLAQHLMFCPVLVSCRRFVRWSRAGLHRSAVSLRVAGLTAVRLPRRVLLPDVPSSRQQLSFNSQRKPAGEPSRALPQDCTLHASHAFTRPRHAFRLRNPIRSRSLSILVQEHDVPIVPRRRLSFNSQWEPAGEPLRALPQDCMLHTVHAFTRARHAYWL